MKIEKYIYLIIIIVALASCGEKKNDTAVQIRGEFKTSPGFENIALTKLNREKTFVAEAVVVDGKFEIAFQAEEADFYQLDFSNNGFLYLILKPGEKLELDVAAMPIRENVTITGSPFTEQFIEVGNLLRPFEIQLDSLNEVYIALANDQERQLRREEFATIAEKIESGRKDVIRNFAKSTPGSLANLFFLNNLDMTQDLEIFVNVLDELKTDYPNNVFVQELNYTVTAEATMQPGMPAPDFELTSDDGSIIKVSDYLGKYLLLDFWASWCAPCRRENPKVVAMYKEFRDMGFEILGVSLDDNREKWIAAIEEDGLLWDQVSDLKKWSSAPAKLYAVRAIPHTVLIDPDGNIVATKLRGNELRYKLEELLNK